MNNNIQSKINDLSSCIDDIESSTDDISRTVDSITSEVDNLRTEITNLKEQLESSKEGVVVDIKVYEHYLVCEKFFKQFSSLLFTYLPYEDLFVEADRKRNE